MTAAPATAVVGPGLSPEQPHGRGSVRADDTMDWLGTTFPRGFHKGCLSNVTDVGKKLYFT